MPNKGISEDFAFVATAIIFIFSFFINLWLPTIIALLCVIRYRKDFVDLLRRALANEWPYNTAGILGIALAFFLYPLASLAANYLITTVTGFHSSFFVNSAILLSMFAYLYLLAFVLAIVTGFVAAIHLDENVPTRAFPIAFGLAVLSLAVVYNLLVKDEKLLDRIEAAILAVDFNPNFGFEAGSYVGKDKKLRTYGTKICRNLPFETLIAPHPQGGYISAKARTTPAKLQMREGNVPVFTTARIYEYVAQSECPIAHEYIETEE